jgi:nitroreductase
MEVREAIYSRRAIKQFEADHRMTAAEEKELLEATIQAPTRFNIQHWRLDILRDPEMRAKIRKEF